MVRRLSTVLAGGASKGRAGENVLREHLAQLPPGMLVTDLRVGGKVVEFGLQLSDGRRLPIDSKWTALAELEALEAADDPVARDACARDVERAVAARAKEVAQYLDPAVTSQVAVAAVPDAAYAVLKRAHADAWSKGVVIVPYSSALPIVLFLYSLVQRFGDSADVQSSLAEVSSALEAMGAVVENKLARAATMLTNGADELRSNLGRPRLDRARRNGERASLRSGGARRISAHGRRGERFAALNGVRSGRRATLRREGHESLTGFPRGDDILFELGESNGFLEERIASAERPARRSTSARSMLFWARSKEESV